MRPSICRRRRPRTWRVCAPGVTTSSGRRIGRIGIARVHIEAIDAADRDAVAFQPAIEGVTADAELSRGVAQIATVGADDLQQGFSLGERECIATVCRETD